MKMFGVLYHFEMKKILGQGVVVVSVLLGVVLIVAGNLLTLLGTGYYYRYDATQATVEKTSAPYREVEAMRRDYLRTLSGEILDNRLMDEFVGYYMDSESGTLMWNLNSYSPFLYLNTKPDRSGISADQFYQEPVMEFTLEYVHETLTDTEREYWRDKASTLEPFCMDYAGGWHAMAQCIGLLCQLTLLLTTVCLCRVFSQEHRTRTDQLVLSSAKGKTVAFWARWAAGISFAGGLALGFSFLHIMVCCVLYGFDGAATPLQLWNMGSSYPLHLSIGGFVAVLVALLGLACVMTATLVMLLSEWLRTAVLALVVPFGLSAATLLELFHGKGRLVEQIVNYLPFNRIHIRTLEDYYLVFVGGVSFHSLQFSFFVYAVLVVVFGVLCWQCYRSYQVTGR